MCELERSERAVEGRGLGTHIHAFMGIIRMMESGNQGAKLNGHSLPPFLSLSQATWKWENEALLLVKKEREKGKRKVSSSLALEKDETPFSLSLSFAPSFSFFLRHLRLISKKRPNQRKKDGDEDEEGGER